MVGVDEVDVVRSPADDEDDDHQPEHLDKLLLVLPDPDAGGPGDDHLGLSLLLISETFLTGTTLEPIDCQDSYKLSTWYFKSLKICKSLKCLTDGINFQ